MEYMNCVSVGAFQVDLQEVSSMCPIYRNTYWVKVNLLPSHSGENKKLF